MYENALQPMDLFSTESNKNTNLLPKNGTVYYHGSLMSQIKANQYLSELLENIDWKNDQTIIFGKLIITKRKVAWYGDKNFSYTYSNTTKEAMPWTPALLELKSLAETTTGETYNSCLLNLYHDGNEGMGWHSDAEKDLKKNGAIASMSFGADRKFAFKNKESKETISMMLQNGSLLVMKDETQTHWLHRLPPTTLISKPRVNLTFRTIIVKD